IEAAASPEPLRRWQQRTRRPASAAAGGAQAASDAKAKAASQWAREADELRSKAVQLETGAQQPGSKRPRRSCRLTQTPFSAAAVAPKPAEDLRVELQAEREEAFIN
uniref:Kinesin motor domain-containing protein n=1 Tax=Macrostomum lignano TaxID=282301 RepID=A0A1I8FJJ5_9PLAT